MTESSGYGHFVNYTLSLGQGEFGGALAGCCKAGHTKARRISCQDPYGQMPPPYAIIVWAPGFCLVTSIPVLLFVV